MLPFLIMCFVNWANNALLPLPGSPKTTNGFLVESSSTYLLIWSILSFLPIKFFVCCIAVMRQHNQYITEHSITKTFCSRYCSWNWFSTESSSNISLLVRGCSVWIAVHTYKQNSMSVIISNPIRAQNCEHYCKIARQMPPGPSMLAFPTKRVRREVSSQVISYFRI